MKFNLYTLLTLPVVAGALYAGSVSSVDANSCNAVLDLSRTLSQNSATVKNNSLNQCDYTVTLAVYDAPKAPETAGWIEAQTLIGSDTRTVNPGETIELLVSDNGKACYRQSDLFEGDNILTPPYYYNNLATDVYSKGNCGGGETTPTPTPENTPTPTPGPTSTPTPGPTSTPTPGPTATPTPKQEVAGAVATFASTGNNSFISAFIIAGGAAIIAGLLLRRFTRKNG